LNNDWRLRFKMHSDPEVDRELERITKANDLLQKEVELPFLHAYKWYSWARAFYESKNKINLLTAANQASKSSTQIRRALNHATNKELWPELWNSRPNQFWYLYPTRDQIDAEFETKWKLFLPRGAMKEDPYYGWTMERRNGHIGAIHFNSGVHLYFKTYSQDAQALQSGTCDEIFCDEELDVDLFDELCFRLTATDGYFNMVFTATQGQDQWRRAMEPGEGEEEFLPQAFKQTVSLYECLKYEDDTPGPWTLERIKAVEQRCSTVNEIQKRVFGRFIVSGGLKYESFDIKRHFKEMPAVRVPKGWLLYAGADPGGGGKSHPSALVYVAVKPNYRAGRVFLGWRGDGIVTTAGDVVNKHISLAKLYNLREFTDRRYDWGSKDFGEIAQRMGHPFQKAEKSHEKGEEVLNTLFKNNMLFIYEDHELRKLGHELATLKKDAVKRHEKDDFADALRYCVTTIPWDWTAVMESMPDESPEEVLTPHQQEVRDRRRAFEDDSEREKRRIEDEFEEWNQAYEGD
jgi:hypothetical protein